MAFQNILGIINILIVGATGVVVWMYTKAAQRSNEIQEQPLINLYFKSIPNPGGSELGSISMKNIGKGPAYNVSFEPIILQDYTYNFFLDNPILEKDQEEKPRAVIHTPDGGTEMFEYNLMWFLARLIPQKITPESLEYAKNNPAIFLIKYMGTNGKEYYSVFAFFDNLPPTSDMLMKFITHESGDISLGQAKDLWKKSRKFNSPFAR